MVLKVKRFFDYFVNIVLDYFANISDNVYMQTVKDEIYFVYDFNTKAFDESQPDKQLDNFTLNNCIGRIHIKHLFGIFLEKYIKF